jgi:hypothetical protein
MAGETIGTGLEAILLATTQTIGTGMVGMQIETIGTGALVALLLVRLVVVVVKMAQPGRASTPKTWPRPLPEAQRGAHLPLPRQLEATCTLLILTLQGSRLALGRIHRQKQSLLWVVKDTLL